MMPALNRFQKNVIIFVFAIIVTFLSLYISFSTTSIGTIGGLIVATALSLFTLVSGIGFWVIQNYRNQQAYQHKHKSSNQLESTQTRTIEVSLSQAETFDLALQALESLNNTAISKTRVGIPSRQTVKIHTQNRYNGYIRAGLRAKTFGIQDKLDFSTIEVHIITLPDDVTRLTIKSYPNNPLEMFDLGRHLHYVNQISLFIRQVVASDNLRDTQVKNTLDLSNTEEANSNQNENEA